jgi:diguanylate cyclase (GGDEF)-like protein
MIVRSGEPLLVSDWTSEDPGLGTAPHSDGGDMLSYLGVPMFSEGRVLGVMSVQSEQAGAFDLHDQGLLQAMAAQTAMALENARLHDVAQEGARTDSLTNTYNHGCFVRMVHEAVLASDRDDSQVSLIMLDIDHFKRYNDTYGHVAGDNVLMLVAQVLKASAGPGALVGRWGGEEFGVLLPDCGLSETKRVARQIRRAVAELVPADGHGRPIASPTVSQGISTYPNPSSSASDLISEADAALYHAKVHGRNQLVVWDTFSPIHETSNNTTVLGLTGSLKDATITTGNLTND